ncbi:hypothetical protein HpMS107_36270 [Helicobacter pylori]
MLGDGQAGQVAMGGKDFQHILVRLVGGDRRGRHGQVFGAWLSEAWTGSGRVDQYARHDGRDTVWKVAQSLGRLYDESVTLRPRRPMLLPYWRGMAGVAL